MSEEDQVIVDNLLSNDIGIAKSALAQTSSSLSSPVNYALILIWQLHSDEEFQCAAKDKLDDFLDFEYLSKFNKVFEIFRSLNESMPWNDAFATEKQQSNFKAFCNFLPEFEILMATHSIYTELLLDAGRKLMLIFQLETESRILFEIVAKHNPANDEALYALGRMEERLGNAEKALVYFEGAIAANPDNSFAQMQCGHLKTTFFEKYEEALLHFTKASESDPYSVEPYVKMAETAYKIGNIPQTRQYLEIALSINEYHEEALNLQGILLWKVDQEYEAAVETFKKGIDHKIHEDSALLLKSLGDIYAEHFQEFNKARLFYEKSLRLNPAQKKLLESFVPFILKEFQDLGAVELAYSEYLRKMPKDSEILLAFANFLCEYLNDFDTAYHFLEEALEIKPDNQAALKLLRKISDYVDRSKNETAYTEDEQDDEDDEITIDIIDIDDDWEDNEDGDDFSGGGAAGDN